MQSSEGRTLSKIVGEAIDERADEAELPIDEALNGAKRKCENLVDAIRDALYRQMDCLVFGLLAQRVEWIKNLTGVNANIVYVHMSIHEHVILEILVVSFWRFWLADTDANTRSKLLSWSSISKRPHVITHNLTNESKEHHHTCIPGSITSGANL